MARSRISRELLVAVAASVGLHAVWLVREAKASSRKDSVSEVSLEAVLPPPKAKEPAPEGPAVPVNTPAEPVLRSKLVHTQAAASRSLPAAAAQAAKTLTAPDNDGSSQLADFTMVQGEGSSYVGGTTSSRGTSRVAVNAPAVDGLRPAPGPTVAPRAEIGPDRSRSAMPAVAAWDCSRLFPADADAGDFATVLIAVAVGVDGLPKRVAMLRDPGHGFGSAAVQCAMSQRYHVALDKSGAPVQATTPPIIVRFSR
jgi:periplasmic protein TonB